MMNIQLLLPLLMLIMVSCSTTTRSVSQPEEENLFITRMYIGDYEDYRHTAPARVGDPHLIWIKTSRDSTYGKISAYSRDCRFHKGERLFLRRKYVSPGPFGYWLYQIENDSSLYYKVSEFQHDRKVLIQSWY